MVWLSVFIPWIFLLCLSGCGEEDIEFKPGPIMSDIIQNREKDKKLAAENQKKTEHLSRSLTEDVLPVVDREKASLQRADELNSLLENAGALPAEDLETPSESIPQILLHTLKGREGADTEVILIPGSLIKLKDLKRALEINSTNIQEAEETRADERRLRLEASPLRPEKANLPILISAIRFELEEDESIETDGRDLWILAEKIIINGELSTRPRRAPGEMPGRHGGNVYFVAMVLETGDHASLDLSGGDAGEFKTEVPIATKKQLEKIHKEAIQQAFTFQRVENEELEPSDEIVQKLLRAQWPKIKEELSKKVEEHLIAPPWEAQPTIHTRSMKWEVSAKRSGKVASPTGRYPLIPIPEIEFTSNLDGGQAGQFSSRMIRGEFPETQILRDSGKPEHLANKRRPQFRIREEDKQVVHTEEFEYEIEVRLMQPEFRTVTRRIGRPGGEGNPTQDREVFEEYKQLFRLQFKRALKTSSETWFEGTVSVGQNPIFIKPADFPLARSVIANIGALQISAFLPENMRTAFQLSSREKD